VQPESSGALTLNETSDSSEHDGVEENGLLVTIGCDTSRVNTESYCISIFYGSDHFSLLRIVLTALYMAQ
jgi:hypothetical protein